jgi:hypothetical protein
MWFVIFACTPADPVVVPTAPVPTPPVPTSADAEVVRAVAAGAPEQDLLPVARGGGLPVFDGGAGTWLFVRVAPGEWSLAGDFNDWTPEPMVCAGGRCLAEVVIADPEGARYKFVQGAEYLADPWARSSTYDEFGPISFVRPPVGEPRLDWWPMAAMGSISERSVRVWVPATPHDRVLYAHDGQNLFDPAAPWGGWRLQEALGDTPMLVVGIDNGPGRFEDYTHVQDDIGSGGLVGGNSSEYADFLRGPVRSMVDDAYGLSGPEGLMGSSLGGLVSLDIARRSPGEFAFVASLSGTLGWGRFGDVGTALPELWLASDPGGVLFLSSGGGPGADGVCTDPDGDGYAEDDPDASDNYCENRAFADDLAASGRTWDVDLVHWWEVDANHDEAAWAAQVHRPLALFAEL